MGLQTIVFKERCYNKREFLPENEASCFLANS